MTHLDFAPEHAHSYNELIEVVKLNLLLADWNDEDHNESLLSVRNSRWGKEMLRNVRSAAVMLSFISFVHLLDHLVRAGGPAMRLVTCSSSARWAVPLLQACMRAKHHSQ